MTLLRVTLSFFIIINLSACQQLEVKEPAADDLVEEVKGPARLTLLSEVELSSQIKMTAADEETAQKVLEQNFTKQPSEWQAGVAQQASILMTPTRTFQRYSIYCRDYSVIVSKNSVESLTINGIACRNGHQLWANVSEEDLNDDERSLSSEPVVENKKIMPARNDVEVENPHFWVIQLASYYEKEDATRFVGELNELGSGYDPQILKASVNDRVVYRVQVNIRHDKQIAKKVMACLKKKFQIAPLVFPSTV